MSDRSAIEWTDASWNPIRARLEDKIGAKAKNALGWHCEHVSEGCRNCYAERMNRRLGTGLDYKPGHRGDVEIYLDPEVLTLPLRWKRPRKIFVGSMTDVFADFVTDAMLDRMLAVMALCPQHTFQVLTKRSGRMREYIGEVVDLFHVGEDDMDERFGEICVQLTASPCAAGAFAQIDWPLANVWLGVSCEDQEQWDARTRDLRATPAAMRFVSVEPMLGPVAAGDFGADYYYCDDAIDGDDPASFAQHRCRPPIDWVIAGGESGPGARPMHPDWVRALRKACATWEVAFFFKQWGEFAPAEHYAPASHAIFPDGSWFRAGAVMGATDVDEVTARAVHRLAQAGYCYARLSRDGKARAGRLLDGVEHNAFPAPRAPAFALLEPSP